MAERQRYEIIEDRQLVAAALAGVHRAFDDLVRRYRGAVILVAWKALGSRQPLTDESVIVALAPQMDRKDLGRLINNGPNLLDFSSNRAVPEPFSHTIYRQNAE